MSITVPFPETPGPPVSSPDSELEINRLNTKEFIDADPVYLVLVPQVHSKTAGGGKAWQAGTPRSQQTFRLIPQGDVQPSVMTPDGIQLTPTFVLFGEWFAAMDRWDVFTHNGNTYQIVSTIRPEHTVDGRYFSKADVARH